MSTITTDAPAASRRYLITGATSGIGAAISRQLLRAGHRVVGLGRDFTKLDCAADEAFEAVVLDLADLDRLPTALDTLLPSLGTLDGAILAAGRGHLAHLEEFSYAHLRALMDLNFTSQAFVARALVPQLKRRGHGDLVFIGSEAAFAGKRQGSVYCASKFALRGFAQALREESGKSGLRVSLIHPGLVRTPFFDELKIEPGSAEGQALAADDVAAAVLYVLAQGPGVVIDELRLSAPTQVVARK